MNYIKKLQLELAVHKAQIRAIQSGINEFNSFLHSAKFVGEENGERKDWISTGDVISRLKEIERAGSDAVVNTIN